MLISHTYTELVVWDIDRIFSLTGLTLNTPGDLAISLGTSDTVSNERVKKLHNLLSFHVVLNTSELHNYTSIDSWHYYIQVFGVANDHKPSLVGHTFPNPVDTESYMVMLVYKNGSLTREGMCVMKYCIIFFIYFCILFFKFINLADVRNKYANKSWEVFNSFLLETPPLNG